MDEAELARIDGNVATNTVRIRAIENTVRIYDDLIVAVSQETTNHSEYISRITSEIEDIRRTLNGLKRLLDDADEGMYDTEQLLGDVKDLLYGV